MNAPKKLRGGTGSELTRFKILWRDSMSESARDFWRALFVSDSTQADIRRQLAGKLQVKFTRDDQLAAFRDWEFQQRMMDLESEQAAEEERRLVEEHPTWTKDQVRDDLLKRFYLRARARGDTELGLETVAADVKVQTLEFDKEKFKEAIRSKLEAGLAELAQYIKGNPKAQAAYEAFKGEVKLATK